jgi:cell pole-organizing protein PopZ
MTSEPEKEASTEEILASIRRVITGSAGRVASSPDPSAPDESSDEDDVLILTAVVEQDGDVVDRAAPDIGQGETAGEGGEAHDGGAANTENAAGTSTENEGVPDTRHGLAEGAAVGEGGDESGRGLSIAAGSAATLEDIVREMLGPMIQTWLDRHLPQIVERVVQDEVRKTPRDPEE